MLRHHILYAAIVSVLLAGSPVALTPAARAEAQLDVRGPTPALMADILAWLAANTDLPESSERPRVELVPATQLGARRFKEARQTGRQGGVNTSAVQAAPHREVVALYNDDARTILLADTWTGRTPAEVSILVHEMVHHLQSVNNLKYECPGAREVPAYLAQDRWLGQFGSSLEKEFEVDAPTLFIMSICQY